MHVNVPSENYMSTFDMQIRPAENCIWTCIPSFLVFEILRRNKFANSPVKYLIMQFLYIFHKEFKAMMIQK